MKAVVLDAMLKETATAQTLNSLLVEKQIDSSWFRLKDLKILPCHSCGACGTRVPGLCVQKDDMLPVMRSMAESDLIVFLTPVEFGGYSPLMKKAIDRTMPLGETLYFTGDGSRSMLYSRKYLLAIGCSGVNYNDAENFRRLVSRSAARIQSRCKALVLKPSDKLIAYAGSIDGALTEVTAG